MNTFIFSKNTAEIAEFSADLSTIVDTPINIKFLAMNPCGLLVNYNLVGDTLKIKAKSGEINTSYCLNFLIQGTSEEKEIRVVILVNDNITPIRKSAPDAFMDLVGTMRSGETTVSTVVFNIDQNIDVKQGYIIWELINNNSEVISSGNAFSYTVQNNGLENQVLSECLIVCPSDILPTAQGNVYQIRYTLSVNEQNFYQYEAVHIESNISVPIGSQDIVELVGNKTTCSIVLPNLYEHVGVTIYYDNNPITSEKEITEPLKVSSGWQYSAVLDTSAFTVSLESYDVVYRFYNNENQVFTEASKLWIINPSIRSAADDILAKIWKARASLYGSPDLVYTMPTLLTWMRRGMDIFNGWQGKFTSITMTNAKGAIREYWLLCSELGALEAQYLAEGEKAFNFSGAAISLDVDRTGFLESMASNIRNNLDQNLTPLKSNMLQKGYTQGDGSGTDGKGGIQTKAGSLGCVGISITPASAWGRFYPVAGNLIGRAWL